MPPPAAAPLDPTPRQLLAVVHNLAAGMDEMSAAALANLPPDTVPRLRGTPHFDGLLAECRAFDARPAPERDAVLQALLRRAVERALADDRVGAIAAALRLLGMLPQPRPAPPPRARRGRPGWLADDEDDDDPREAEFRGEPASGEAWGMEDDGEGGWLGPDGRPALPGREVDVIAAPNGPARLVDTLGLPGSLPAYIELLDGLDENRVGQHNRAAYPYGGPQWDPKTRTLWLWEGKGPRLSPSERERAREQGIPLGDEDEVDASDAPPSYPLSRREVGEGRGEGAGTGVPNTYYPDPGPLPRPREREHEGASAANPPTTTPAPRASHPPSPATELRARLDLLLAGTAPVAPADIDLAEAVCALRWPKWPDYRGDLDLNAVRLALAGRTWTAAPWPASAAPTQAWPPPPPKPPRRASRPPTPPAATPASSRPSSRAAATACPTRGRRAAPP